jgi:hypothetical protein
MGLFIRNSSLLVRESIKSYKVFEVGHEEKCPEKWRRNDWILHHDNARPHTAYVVQEFLAKNKMAVVPHPPYLQLLSLPQDENQVEGVNI